MQKREGDEKYGPMKAGRASRMVNLPDALLLSSSLSFVSKMVISMENAKNGNTAHNTKFSVTNDVL